MWNYDEVSVPGMKSKLATQLAHHFTENSFCKSQKRRCIHTCVYVFFCYNELIFLG